MSLAPLFLTALLILRPIMGWHSVVFDPMTNRTSASSISEMELLMAPSPKAANAAATVDAWQRRAQWSTLVVPKTALENF